MESILPCSIHVLLPARRALLQGCEKSALPRGFEAFDHEAGGQRPDSLHQAGDAPIGRPHQEMHMVRHKDVSKQFKRVISAELAQGCQKLATQCVVQKKPASSTRARSHELQVRRELQHRSSLHNTKSGCGAPLPNWLKRVSPCWATRSAVTAGSPPFGR